MLKSIHFDSKHLTKILHICKRLTVLLSGEEVRTEAHHTVFTSACDGAQPTPGNGLDLDTSRLHLPCLQARVERQGVEPSRTGLLTAAERRGSWLQGGSKKSISISLGHWSGQRMSGDGSRVHRELLPLSCNRGNTHYNSLSSGC